MKRSMKKTVSRAKIIGVAKTRIMTMAANSSASQWSNLPGGEHTFRANPRLVPGCSSASPRNTVQFGSTYAKLWCVQRSSVALLLNFA